MEGIHLRNLDPKGRVVMPDEFRGYLGNPFILARGPEGILMAFRTETWRSIIRWRDNPAQPGLYYPRSWGHFRGYLFEGGTEVEIRGMNRFTIPKPWRQEAGLAPYGDVALVWQNGAVLVCRSSLWHEHVEYRQAEHATACADCRAGGRVYGSRRHLAVSLAEIRSRAERGEYTPPE